MPKLGQPTNIPSKRHFFLFRSWWEEINAMVRAFEAVQEKYSAYGAWDSEPSAVFGDLVGRAMQDAGGQLVKAPTDAESWQLYMQSMDCTQAAAELGRACQDVLNLFAHETVPWASWSKRLDQLRTIATIIENVKERCGLVLSDSDEESEVYAFADDFEKACFDINNFLSAMIAAEIKAFQAP